MTIAATLFKNRRNIACVCKFCGNDVVGTKRLDQARQDSSNRDSKSHQAKSEGLAVSVPSLLPCITAQARGQLLRIIPNFRCLFFSDGSVSFIKGYSSDLPAKSELPEASCDLSLSRLVSLARVPKLN